MTKVLNSLQRSVLLLTSLTCVLSLSVDFYDFTCPEATSIVTQTINSLATQSNVVPPSVLRLFFHDSLVNGCDASILISSTPDNQAERDFPDNQSIRQEAFDAIEQAKQAVENLCPGIVSCADILALAARDAVVFTGGPSWDVPLGRLDGLVSTASSVQGRLPGANFNVSQLTESFASIGLSQDDMVILSGAHTIGFCHCNQFTDRLYNFDGTQTIDPSFASNYAQTLEGECPETGVDPSEVVAFDPTTAFTFDSAYYSNLQNGEGLLSSDEVLFTDSSTQDLVNQLAASQDFFFSSFANSMITLSSVVGSGGNIRQVCSAFNS